MAWRLVLIYSLLWQSVSGTITCQNGTIKEAPFYVSDEYNEGDQIYQSVYDVENPEKVEKYIPRDSLVRVDPELFENSKHPKERVPFEVLSLPNSKREESLKDLQQENGNFDNLSPDKKNLKRIKKGEKGFVHTSSLRRVDRYIFMLKKSAPVFKTPGNVGKTVALSFDVTDEGKFKVRRCCDDQTGKCFYKYEFKLLDARGTVIGSKLLTVDGCEVFNHVRPLKKEVAAPVLSVLRKIREEQGLNGYSIGDLELLSPALEWDGDQATVKRPTMAKFPFDHQGLGPYNTYHYKPDDNQNSDSYLRPLAMCAFMNSFKEQNKVCSPDNRGCLIQLGNMYHDYQWGIHTGRGPEGHHTGKCIDMRPLRSDSSMTMSVSRTQKFVNILKENGADYIIYNHPDIKGVERDNSGVHDNHLHVCMNLVSPNVIAACKK